MCFFFCFISHKSLFVALLWCPWMAQIVLLEKLKSRQKSILCDIRILSIWVEWRDDLSVQAQSILLQCALEWREFSRERRWSSGNIETEFSCFLCRYIQANQNQRRRVRLLFETRVAGLDPSISSELHHQFLGEPTSCPISWLRIPESYIIIGRNIIPLPFVNWDRVLGMIASGSIVFFGCDARVSSVLANVACGFPDASAKSESWNKTHLQCWAVFPTWQNCRESFCVVNVWNQTS